MIPRILTLFVFALLLFSCGNDIEEMKNNLNGYWEIHEVEKDGKLIKAYTINVKVDYFELNNDSTGFRKKVSPNLDGTFVVTQHQMPFVLRDNKGALQILYSDNGVTHEETIIEASAEQLRIENDRGYVYTYKPFEGININE
ncbi:MAG: hypothetical protein HKO90_04720 [Flavobacteriaceae bacterium]|nr:hypothetical protein [Flavobacteriaceae bacterium]